MAIQKKTAKNSIDPETLIEEMGKASYEFTAANRELRKIELKVYEAIAKTSIMIYAKNISKLKNTALKTHLTACFDDPKFKPTVEFVKHCNQLEHQELLEKYQIAEMVAKQAKDEFEMWQKQLMWHQSKMKMSQLELMSLGAIK